MIIDGSFIVLAVGAYLAYRVACWIGEPAKTPNRENGSEETR